MKRRFWFFLLAFGFVGTWALLAYTYQQPHRFNGAVIEPPAVAHDFTLENYNGRDFRLSEQRGKVVLLFFGYTSCPDVCPTTLAQFRRVNESLGAQASSVRFVFVTADPERDTPEKIGSYLTQFDPSFVGLYGSNEALQAVYDEFGIFVEKQESNGAAGYLVSHAASVLLIDPAGSLRMTFPYGMDASAMSADISQILKEQ